MIIFKYFLSIIVNNPGLSWIIYYNNTFSRMNYRKKGIKSWYDHIFKPNGDSGDIEPLFPDFTEGIPLGRRATSLDLIQSNYCIVI